MRVVRLHRCRRRTRQSQRYWQCFCPVMCDSMREWKRHNETFTQTTTTLAQSRRTWHSQKEQTSGKEIKRNPYETWMVFCVDGTTETRHERPVKSKYTYNDIGSGPQHFTLFHLRNDKLEKFIQAVVGAVFSFPPHLSFSAFPMDIFATSDVAMLFPKPWMEFNKSFVGLYRRPRRSRNDKNLMNFLCRFKFHSLYNVAGRSCSCVPVILKNNGKDAPDWRTDHFNCAIEQ